MRADGFFFANDWLLGFVMYNTGFRVVWVESNFRPEVF